MTENLLQKLEEKTMTMLSELEKLRDEVKQLKHDNLSLKTEKESNTQKLEDLVALLETTTSDKQSEDRIFLQTDAVSAA